ncbi:hypothetical protein HC928_10525, partial [bacterium]|nr:hypothetical protein [bacterium]
GIIATDVTWTIPNCAESIDVFYSFNLTGCTEETFDLDLLEIEFGDLEDNVIVPDGRLARFLPPNRVELAGDGAMFIEYKLSISPDDAGIYNVTIKFNGEDVTVKIQIIARDPVTDYRDLSCREEVNITLDENCEAQLLASMLLKGNQICNGDFCVHVVHVINGRSYVREDGIIPSEWGCGRYIYRVYGKDANGNCDLSNIICWGYVNAEDKTAPRFEYCPEEHAREGQRSTRVYSIEGHLGDNTAFGDADNFNDGAYDQVFDPTIQTCFRTTSIFGAPVLDVLGKYRYFDLHEFRVERAGIYTFLLGTEFDYSGLAAIYAGAKDNRANTRAPFDPYQPCSDIIAFGDYTFAPGPWSGLGEYLNFIGNLNGWSVFLSRFLGGQGDTEPFIHVYLRPGVVYTLLTSSTREYDDGDYEWLVFPPTNDPTSRVFTGRSGSTQLAVFDEDAKVTSPLICTDIDKLQLPSSKCYTVDKDGKVLNINATLKAVLEQTGYPHYTEEYEQHYFHGTITDNCGNITVCVGDLELDHDPYDNSYLGDCDYRIIKRTFTAQDECNGLRAEPCYQYIKVRKPTMEDVVLPHYTAYIECDETYQTIAGTDRPSPESTGYPFVVTAFGYYDLGRPGAQVYCNLSASFEDKGRVDVCSESFYFIREWIVTDWCNPGRTIIYNQLIKVGDFTAPNVGELPRDPWDCAPTFSTGPFQCKSNFVVPTPDGLSDNCSADGIKISVSIIAFVPEYDDHGFLTGDYDEQIFQSGLKPGQVVNNVPKGLHLFKYVVEDGCKNKTTRYYWFQVLDRSEPVAQCDDFLNVSLSGQAVNGSTRIYAEDIDEGSYDDCGPIELQVRRTFEDEVCADQYSQLFFGKAFSALGFFTAEDLADYFDYPQDAYNQYYHEFVDGYFTVDGNGNPVAAVFTLEPKAGTADGEDQLFSILGDYVDILCCDVKDSVTIELWVFDDANMDGIPGNYNYAQYGDYGQWIYDLCGSEGDRSDYFYPCAPECGKIWDNHNICWMEILVEDKAKPICKPPQDIYVNCTDDRVRYEDAFTCEDSLLLNQFFGVFIGVDNCEVYMECVDVEDNRNNCGVGKIVRAYQAVDGWGNRSAVCYQTIYVQEVHDYIIGFPADKEGECADVLDTTIYLLENACDLLTVNVYDRRFTGTPGGECYKIEREFRVLNWCEYDGQSAPTVIGRDVDLDGKPGDEDIWVIRRPSNAFADRAGSSSRNWTQTLPKFGSFTTTGVTLPNENASPPSNSETFWDDKNRVRTNAGTKENVNPIDGNNFDNGYWQYTQFIKVYDDIDPIVTAEPVEACSYSSDVANGCPAPVDVPFVVEENCTPNDLTIKVFLDAFTNGTIDADSRVEGGNTLKSKFGASVTGTYPNFVISGGSYPLGSHVFEVHVLDGCGNSTVARIPFTVVDCKAPTPICINGLSVELMPVIPAEDVDGDGDDDSGAMAIWAKDFADEDKLFDCSAPVKLAIYRSDDEALQDSTFVPDPAQTSIMVTCDDFEAQTTNPNGAGGTVLVRVYAIDAVGNFDYCETYVLVQDNQNGLCGSQPDQVSSPV